MFTKIERKHANYNRGVCRGSTKNYCHCGVVCRVPNFQLGYMATRV